MIDGMGRPRVRSLKQKTQQKCYSGKKKRHVRKHVVVTDYTKRIQVLSFTKYGCVHNKKIYDKTELHINKHVSILADTGFQGIPNRPYTKEEATRWCASRMQRKSSITLFLHAASLLTCDCGHQRFNAFFYLRLKKLSGVQYSKTTV